MAKPSKDVVVCGINSSYAAELLEMLIRLELKVAAGILMSTGGWSLRGFTTILRKDEVSDLLTGLPLVLAIIGPKRRREAVDWALDRGFSDFPNVIDPLAHVSPSAFAERGVSVGAGSVIGAAAELDSFVTVNRKVSVGHHTALEAFVTLGPGSSIASHCRIETGAMVGTGAVIAPSMVIGAHATVGAGAVVLKDVPPGVTVIGNPARLARAAPPEAANQSAAYDD